jgi:hypothetical protein
MIIKYYKPLSNWVSWLGLVLMMGISPNMKNRLIRYLSIVILLLTTNIVNASEIFENVWKPNINLKVNGNERWIIQKDSVYNFNAFNICEDKNHIYGI